MHREDNIENCKKEGMKYCVRNSTNHINPHCHQTPGTATPPSQNCNNTTITNTLPSSLSLSYQHHQN